MQKTKKKYHPSDFGYPELPMISSRKHNKNNNSENMDPYSYVGKDSPRWTIKGKPEIDSRTLTSDIELPNIESDFGKRKISMGHRKDTVFFYPREGSGVLPPPISTLNHTGVHIQSRYPVKTEITPGPSSYTPVEPLSPKLYTIAKSPRRNDWLHKDESIPGPGAYDIEKPLRRAPRWFVNKRVTADYATKEE